MFRPWPSHQFHIGSTVHLKKHTHTKLHILIKYRKKQTNSGHVELRHLSFISTDHLSLLWAPAPDPRFVPGIKALHAVMQILAVGSQSPTGAHMATTSQRKCCACWDAWRRWATWASAPCSPGRAAWPPGGRARREETEPVALCKLPVSRGQPPSPQHHHLKRKRHERHVIHRHEREATVRVGISHTFALEDIAAASFQPCHVFETQEGGVHAEARTALPNPVDVAGTHLWHQGNWEKIWIKSSYMTINLGHL